MVASTAGIPSAACLDHAISRVFGWLAFLFDIPNLVRVAAARGYSTQHDWHDGLGGPDVFDQGVMVTHR
jgi:hypothetical protein